ncbi:hypothetical protein M2263_001326 [Providencia alcalifaciens]|nr:hypothetical protein [Providencia alcalifaciens]
MQKNNKKFNLFILLLCLFCSGYASADCNMKKAAANKAIEKRVGISGDCDARLAVENKIQKPSEAIKKGKEIKEHRENKEKTTKNKEKVKSKK